MQEFQPFRMYAAPDTERIRRIVEMRKDGMSFAEIGQAFDISRQRAQQIYKRVAGENYEHRRASGSKHKVNKKAKEEIA